MTSSVSNSKIEFLYTTGALFEHLGMEKIGFEKLDMQKSKPGHPGFL